jgi:YggT family protein
MLRHRPTSQAKCDRITAMAGTLRVAGRAARVRRRTGENSLVTIVFQLLDQVLGLYWWAVILAAVMSNLIAFGILDTRNRLVWTVTDFLYRITEPALRWIRRFIPSFGGIDLSPLVLLLGIWVVRNLLGRIYQAVVFGGLQPLFY